MVIHRLDIFCQGKFLFYGSRIQINNTDRIFSGIKFK